MPKWFEMRVAVGGPILDRLSFPAGLAFALVKLSNRAYYSRASR
jgi:hypothetical protein